MKQFAAITLAVMSLGMARNACAQDTRTLRIFDGALFYDGYLLENNPDKDVQDGILRHTTYLYAVRLTDEQLDAIGNTLNFEVQVQACCDNYDRIGNINLALVPKGQESYRTDEVERIELGRFITPFMNKNKTPDTVPYSYWMDYLSPILRDATLRGKYDLWMEFELFGIPYAANEQIAGCADRNDVFKGTLDIVTGTPAMGPTTDNVLVPIVIKKPEYKGNNLNNYNEAATDTIGKTVKTYSFDVPEDVSDGQIVLITSNHGANSGGEEYNRRWHYVYVDDELMLTYKPGRTSCEPFRKYNTQSNGIYGIFRRTDASWQSFSNWCPGDVIDNRIIGLGAVKAGTHKVTISVPEAQFADKQGDIPVSMFFQGAIAGTLPTGISGAQASPQELRIGMSGGVLTIDSDVEIIGVEVYDTAGRQLYRKAGNHPVVMTAWPDGIYLVNAELADGIIETHKIVKK